MKILKFLKKIKDKISNFFKNICEVDSIIIDESPICTIRKKVRKRSKYRSSTYSNEELHDLFILLLPDGVTIKIPAEEKLEKFAKDNNRTLKNVNTKIGNIFKKKCYE